MKDKTKKIRISLDVTESFHERLERLEELVDGESKAGVIRQALQLYEYLAKRHLEGARFKIVQAGQEQELAFFGLPEVS